MADRVPTSRIFAHAVRAMAGAVARGMVGGSQAKALATIPTSRGGWYPIIRESYAGAWQQNVEVSAASVMVYSAVFACMTLIASDISKLPLRLVSKDAEGIWSEASNPAFSPVLRKPNPYQTRIQFVESWVLSKLSRGNTVALKRRDARGVVIGLYILDWNLVRPLISDGGDIFYELRADNVSGIRETVVVPAREIIHDRWNCLYHPLIGLSPIVACGLAATQGLRIQENSANFFAHGSTPPGILTAAGHIDQTTADRLKSYWEENYTGDNSEKIAVLGDGLEFKAMSNNAVDSQLIEQLKWTAETACSVFHVPPYKIGIGTMPALQNIQALNLEYYTQCPQVLIEAMELALDDGLGLGEGTANPSLGTEFDLDALLRMDAATQMEVLDKGKNTFTPNEARRRVNLKKVPGGDSVYRQQQDYSLEALAKRDAKEDPFGKAESAAPVAAPEPAPAAEPQPANDDVAAALLRLTAKVLGA